jgi:hypothetical protein
MTAGPPVGANEERIMSFRDVDSRQRVRRLDARTERAALREARAILASRDQGERVVAAGLTIDQLAERDYFPMLDSLAAAGRRSERGVDDDRDRYRLHVKPHLGHMRLGDIEPRHVGELIAAMRARKPKPYAEARLTTPWRSCAAFTESPARAAT